MSEVEDACRVCGTELTKDNIGVSLWIKPYCPDCWPSECPVCGETENYTWSSVRDELTCDQGCHFRHDGNLAEYSVTDKEDYE